MSHSAKCQAESKKASQAITAKAGRHQAKSKKGKPDNYAMQKEKPPSQFECA